MEAMNERRFKTALRVYVRVCLCMCVSCLCGEQEGVIKWALTISALKTIRLRQTALESSAARVATCQTCCAFKGVARLSVYP